MAAAIRPATMRTNSSRLKDHREAQSERRTNMDSKRQQ
jgi:hypothetical protein